MVTMFEIQFISLVSTLALKLKIMCICDQGKPQVPEMGGMFSSYWSKGSQIPLPKHHRLFIGPCYFDYSPQSGGRSLLLKIQLTYVVEHGAILPVPN